MGGCRVLTCRSCARDLIASPQELPQLLAWSTITSKGRCTGELQQQLQMPLIELWIAALLGGFSLEQRGEFYETAEVWVGQSGSQ